MKYKKERDKKESYIRISSDSEELEIINKIA